MWYVVKRLALGVLLIVLASSVLLISDWRHRRPSGGVSVEAVAQAARPIAMFQLSTNLLVDDTAAGVLEGLKREGFESGCNIDVTRFNAEGDLATANSIAKLIADGRFDMVLTLTTPCLQAMASANRDGKIMHVFGCVTDPFGAGVGISRENPLDHPKHLVGIGNFEPVKEIFRLVKKAHPGLKTVGEAWNPAEACSDACTVLAREVCAELGISLIEAQVENSAGVFEACSSLVSRGAEALYVGGDNTVELAIDSVLKAANQGAIPVFTNSPSDATKGTLLNLGANYYQVGIITGQLAADILKGRDPATVPIENQLPKKLALNLAVLSGLRDPWKFPQDMLDSADMIVDEQGVHDKTAAAPAAELVLGDPRKPLSKKWNIHFLNYVEAEHVETAQKGFFERFGELGMVEGRDYTLKNSNAQGDMATLLTLVDGAVGDRADLILLTSTPTLQACIQKAKDTIIIFTNVGSPVMIGAGKSDQDHLPNVTGIHTASDFDGMVTVVKECLPQAKRIGTLFCPAESNSVFYRDALAEAAKKEGLELISVASSTSPEVPNAALSLASQDVDAICQISDNLHGAAFSSIVQAVRKSKLPLFAFVTGEVTKGGAAVGVARDYEQGGRDMAAMAVRVMRGEKPADIPFMPISKTVLVVNTENAAQCGLTVPQSILDRADQVIGAKEKKQN